MDKQYGYTDKMQFDTAFSSLFNDYWNNVYQLCNHYCADECVAKDLTQNIFLSVWERKIKFEDKKSAAQYLSKSAKYQVLNYFRNKKRFFEPDEFTGAQNSIETDRYNPESIYSCNELSNRISLRIDDLPEPSRTIFRLSRYQTMSYLQISDQLGISVKTVEKHISRALKSLRTALIG